MLILLRYFTVDEFGVWSIFLAITSIIEVSLMGLIMNALIKFASSAKDKKTYAKIQTASIFLNVLISSIIVIGLLFLSNFIGKRFGISGELTFMLRIYCATIFILIPFYHFNFIQQANLNFKGVFWSNFVRKGILFLVLVSFLFIGDKQSISALAVVQLIGAIIGSLVAILFGNQYGAFSRKLDMKQVHTLFHYGKYTFGTNVSTMLYKKTDILMLGGMISEIAAGIYQTAISITNLIEVPSLSVASIVFPQGAKQSQKSGEEQKKALRELYEKSVGAILALILPFIVFVFLFPELMLFIIAGEKYLIAAPILRLTILYGLFLPFAIQFGTVLDSMGKPKINFYLTMGSAVLNAIFNWIFIINFGIIGAAYGTLATYSISFLVFQYVLNNILGVKMYRPFQHIPGFYKQGFQLIKQVFRGRNISTETEL